MAAAASTSTVPDGYLEASWAFDFDLSDLDSISRDRLASLPVCQLPTAHWKKLTWLDWAQGRVIKGPYVRREWPKLQRYMWRNWLMRNAFDERNSVLAIYALYDSERDELYQEILHLCPERVQQLFAKYSIEQLCTYHATTNTGHGALWVLPRDHQGVMQASDVRAQPSLRSIRSAAIKGLLLRFVLGIGDSHFGNLLISETKPVRYAFVDAEEDRGGASLARVRSDPLHKFLFSKNCGRRVNDWCAGVEACFAHNILQSLRQRWSLAVRALHDQVPGIEQRFQVVLEHLEDAAQLQQ